MFKVNNAIIILNKSPHINHVSEMISNKLCLKYSDKFIYAMQFSGILFAEIRLRTALFNQIKNGMLFLR